METVITGEGAKKAIPSSEDDVAYGNTKRQLDRQTDYLYKLEAVVDRLQERLHPLLEESYPKPSGPDEDAAWLPPVPDSLRSNNDRLDATISRIVDLTNRIDL